MWSTLRAHLDRLPRWLVHGFWLVLCAFWAVVDYRHDKIGWFGFWCATAAAGLVNWLNEADVKFWQGMSAKWRALCESQRASLDQQHAALMAALPLMDTAARIVSENEASKEKAN